MGLRGGSPTDLSGGSPPIFWVAFIEVLRVRFYIGFMCVSLEFLGGGKMELPMSLIVVSGWILEWFHW